jgi:2-polyprenyl-3-methyl-5-hydroxy-6-metoxy-1,4-benzoquinol methylase
MDESYIEQYENFELHHWWFVARRELIIQALHEHVRFDSDKTPRWLDVGCGTGVLLQSYTRISDKMGLEVDAACVKRAQEKGLNVRQAEEIWDLPRFGRFDVITLCDVLEHLRDEEAAIAAAAAALAENGVLLITVPALPSLWSGHDVVNHHFRRYTRENLVQCLPAAQWEIRRVSYFSSLLLPLIWAARKTKILAQGLGLRSPTHDFRFGHPMVDRVLLAIFRWEKSLIRRRALRLGSSLILIARKKPAAASAVVSVAIGGLLQTVTGAAH